MKTKQLINKLIALSVFIVLLSSCEDKYSRQITHTVNVPIYMTYEELRNSVKSAETEPLQTPGKMYFYQNYLLINEQQKGIHIYDNTNPASPQQIAFVQIPGNVDMAVKNNRLYVDSYIDLVVLDISDMANIHELSRMEGAFPYTYPEYDYNYGLSQIDETKGLIIDWELQEITEIVSEEYYDKYQMLSSYLETNTAMDSYGGGRNLAQAAANGGIAGSMARFMVHNNYLYNVNNWSLQVFEIDGETIQLGVSINLWQNVETIFKQNNYLFLGTQTGMMVYNLDNPAVPNYVSEFSHIQSCDPVVVEGDKAYITLRAGNLCGAFESQLNIIDLQQIENPQLIASYPLTEPYGLGIDNNILFVCDGYDGLKIYEVSNPNNIELLSHFTDIHAFDVIPLGDILVMTGEKGIYQYNYQDQYNITLLSTIEVTSY